MKMSVTYLVGAGELDDLGAQVGGADGAEVLLVRLAVARVLEEHVRRARLHLMYTRSSDVSEGEHTYGRPPKHRTLSNGKKRQLLEL